MADVKFTIDGKEVTVPQGTTVIEAASKVGVEIPHYCYHPGLSIAGNCRMCLVDVEKSPKPMIACNTVATEGMVVKTNTEQVQKMRRSVMEFLLINHPLDCPTCDQAGECRLQDYYMLYDDIPSRFQEEKVHKDKMLDIGANVMLDQERCVACTRCIRFCKEVGGKDELAITNRGDHVTITNFPGQPLTNKYAGNIVDICPVGALTSSDFRFKKRVWFLKSTPSVCVNCSRGCNIEIHHADSTVYRLRPRVNMEVNKYWMCDEGRYGYKFINENRIIKPYLLDNGLKVEAGTDEVLDFLKGRILPNPQEIAVVAHAHETNETLEAWAAFAKNILKTSLLFYSRKDPPEVYADHFLITPDKNPNQATVNRLGFKPLSELKKAKGLLVLNNLSDADLKRVQELKIPVLGLWAANESAVAQITESILPIPTFAEQDGHFVNVQGLTQEIKQAFPPRGEAMPVAESLQRLTEILNEGTAGKRAAV